MHIGEAVAEAVVAVCDRHALLHRHAVTQQPRDLVDGGKFTGLRVLPLRAPPFHLSLDVALALGEVTETDGVDVDGMEVGQHVDEVMAGAHLRCGRQQMGLLRSIEHHTVDETHHVEGCSDHRLVGAQSERGRHRHTGGAHGGDDAVFARHVVRRGEHMPQRRTTQHETGAVGTGDPEREVRSPSGDEVERERRHGTINVGLQPRGDPFDVDALHGRHRTEVTPTRSCPAASR